MFVGIGPPPWGLPLISANCILMRNTRVPWMLGSGTLGSGFLIGVLGEVFEASRLMLDVYMPSKPGRQLVNLMVRQVPPLRDLQRSLWFFQSFT